MTAALSLSPYKSRVRDGSRPGLAVSMNLDVIHRLCSRIAKANSGYMVRGSSFKVLIGTEHFYIHWIDHVAQSCEDCGCE